MDLPAVMLMLIRSLEMTDELSGLINARKEKSECRLVARTAFCWHP